MNRGTDGLDPYVNQLGIPGGENKCLSATALMMLRNFAAPDSPHRRWTLQDYNRHRDKFGDSTSWDAQSRALKALGYNVDFTQNTSIEGLKERLGRGEVVGVGVNHNGGSGHWLVLTGYENGQFIGHDPYGRLRQQPRTGWESSNTSNPNVGRGVRYNEDFFRQIFTDRGPGTGATLNFRSGKNSGALAAAAAGGGFTGGTAAGGTASTSMSSPAPNSGAGSGLPAMPPRQRPGFRNLDTDPDSPFARPQQAPQSPGIRFGGNATGGTAMGGAAMGGSAMGGSSIRFAASPAVRKLVEGLAAPAGSAPGSALGVVAPVAGTTDGQGPVRRQASAGRGPLDQFLPTLQAPSLNLQDLLYS